MNFRPEHIAKILDGTKTQTRRLKCNYRVGHEYSIQPNGRTSVITQKIKILDIHKERLGEITAGGAKAEGCQSIEEFKKGWQKINGYWLPNLEVFVISFEIVSQ